MLIQFSPTALILISPVIPLMSFITKEKISFLVWDPIQNHTLHLVSMSLQSFFVWNSSSTLSFRTLSFLMTNHLFCRMTLNLGCLMLPHH